MEKKPNKNTLHGISDKSEKNILLTLQKMSDIERHRNKKYPKLNTQKKTIL